MRITPYDPCIGLLLPLPSAFLPVFLLLWAYTFGRSRVPKKVPLRRAVVALNVVREHVPRNIDRAA